MKTLQAASLVFIAGAIFLSTLSSQARMEKNPVLTAASAAPTDSPSAASSDQSSDQQSPQSAPPTVSGLQGGTGAPAGLALPAPKDTHLRIPPAENPKVLVVTVEGQSLDPSSIDPQVQYTLRSMRLILSQYNVLMFSNKDIASAQDATDYCSGAFKYYPLLRLSFTKSQATQNTYTSGYHLHIEIVGIEYVCQDKDKTIVPSGLVTTGIEDHTYIANPFSALAATLAFLTSPWINKYKTWLTGPTAIVGSFEHVNDAANGVAYCAAARAMSTLLSSPRWNYIIQPIPPGVPDPVYLPCTPPRTTDVKEIQRKQAQYNASLQNQ